MAILICIFVKTWQGMQENDQSLQLHISFKILSREATLPFSLLLSFPIGVISLNKEFAP